MHPRLRNLLLTTAALIALGAAGTASGKTARSSAIAVPRWRSQSRGEDKKLSLQVLIFRRMALTLRYRHWRFGGRPPRAGTLTMRANSARLVRNGRLRRLFLKLPNLSVRMLPEATALVEKQDPSRLTHGALQIPSRKTTPAPCPACILRRLWADLTVWMQSIWSGLRLGWAQCGNRGWRYADPARWSLGRYIGPTNQASRKSMWFILSARR